MTVLTQMRARDTAGQPTGSPSRALRYLPSAVALQDLALIAVTVLVAAYARSSLPVPIFDSPADVSSSVRTVGPLLAVGWLTVIYFMGGYRADVFGAGTDEYKRVLNATLLSAGLLGVACYATKAELARGFYFLTFGFGVLLLLIGRLTTRQALHRARVRGNLLQGVVIAGSPAYVDEIASVLRREAWLGYHVIGAVTPSPGHTAVHTPSGIPVLGDTADITSLVVDYNADVIFLAGGAVGSGAMMRQLVWQLEQHSVQVVVAPSVTDVSAERIKVRPVGGLPLMHLDPPTWVDATRVRKRLFDLVGSATLLVLLSPLFLIAMLAIKLDDRGPVLFRQTRVGRGGMEFSCLKFRSMVVDAEARLAQLHAESGYVDGLFKLKDDPRITRPGRWLRRLSLDELPQLVNVLRGDMSLVGPRPPLPAEVSRYADDAARRLHVRPGITGLWQVSGRSDLSWEEAIRLDLYYVDNWSMLQDLAILVRTVRAVFGSHGAY